MQALEGFPGFLIKNRHIIELFVWLFSLSTFYLVSLNCVEYHKMMFRKFTISRSKVFIALVFALTASTHQFF